MRMNQARARGRRGAGEPISSLSLSLSLPAVVLLVARFAAYPTGDRLYGAQFEMRTLSLSLSLSDRLL